MIDNEIIKALECCKAGLPEDCIDCPEKRNTSCIETLTRNALDLIKRQHAEIERLKDLLNATIAGQETLQKHINVTKTETIKEFLYSLKHCKIKLWDVDVIPVASIKMIATAFGVEDIE